MKIAIAGTGYVQASPTLYSWPSTTQWWLWTLILAKSIC